MGYLDNFKTLVICKTLHFCLGVVPLAILQRIFAFISQLHYKRLQQIYRIAYRISNTLLEILLLSEK